LHTEEQKYQREVYVEEISAFEIDSFIMDCEVFKNECFLERNAFAETELSKMKEKIQIDHIRDNAVKNNKKKGIPKMFQEMQTKSRLPKGTP
jgi:hypothetical protein